ncbi:MAG: hypothetical protein R3B84_13745 [Zavarzinella sp.]
MKVNRIRNIVAVATACFGAWIVNQQYSQADTSTSDVAFMVDQDVKLLKTITTDYSKATAAKKRVVERNGSRGITSTGLVMAYYANSAIDGKDAANDAKMATLRDLGLKLAKAGKDKDFKGTDEILKAIAAGPKADPAAKKEKIDLTAAIKGMDLSVDDTMHHYFKDRSYGTNVEDMIKEQGKKATVKAQEAAAIAHRVKSLAVYSKVVMNAENAGAKKMWLDYTKEMDEAADKLLQASKGKPADLTKAFVAVDVACTKCHNEFK